MKKLFKEILGLDSFTAAGIMILVGLGGLFLLVIILGGVDNKKASEQCESHGLVLRESLTNGFITCYVTKTHEDGYEYVEEVLMHKEWKK